MLSRASTNQVTDAHQHDRFVRYNAAALVTECRFMVRRTAATIRPWFQFTGRPPGGTRGWADARVAAPSRGVFLFFEQRSEDATCNLGLAFGRIYWGIR